MRTLTLAALAALTIASVVVTPALADMPVSINFAAQVGGEPFNCLAKYNGLGSTKAEVQVVDFRLFVSNVALIKKDGALQPVKLEQDGKWQLEGLALLDFENATGGCVNGTAGTNTAVRGTVPAGDYTGLAFTVGVPFEQNHVDPTVSAAPLNTTAMFWNWQGGYKFVRIDMVPTDRKADGPKGWFLHLGSTMCDAASKTEAPKACKNANRIDIRYDGFDIAKESVVIDPASVVKDADLRINAAETSPGCMSFLKDTDCLTVMAKLGLPYMDVPAATQMLIAKR